MLETNEMIVLRKIVGKTKIARIRSPQIRESCGSLSNLLKGGWKDEEEEGEEEKKETIM